MKLYTIEVSDGVDHEVSVLGIASDRENAERMIDQTYGDYKVIEKKDYKNREVLFSMRVEWSMNGRDFIIDDIIVRTVYLNEV